MAYDILGEFEDDRDYSIGGVAWKAGQKPSEVNTTKQAKAFADLVDREIKNNAAIGVLKKKSGVLDSDDEHKFKNFYVAWHSWLAREIQGAKKPNKKTVEDLKKWRAQNAEWTKKMSEGTETLVRKTESRTMPTTKEKGSRWPLLFGIGVVIGFVFSGKRR